MTLEYLVETGGTRIDYADVAAQTIIAARAGWEERSADRIRREILAALERDERFAKGFAHIEINSHARKVRVYRIAAAPLLVPPAPALALPSDPWRRRSSSAPCSTSTRTLSPTPTPPPS